MHGNCIYLVNSFLCDASQKRENRLTASEIYADISDNISLNYKKCRKKIRFEKKGNYLWTHTILTRRLATSFITTVD